VIKIKDRADAAESIVIFDDDVTVRFDTSGGQLKIRSIKIIPEGGAGADYASFSVDTHPAKVDQLIAVAKEGLKAGATRLNDLLQSDLIPEKQETKMLTADDIEGEMVVLDDAALP